MVTHLILKIYRIDIHLSKFLPYCLPGIKRGTNIQSNYFRLNVIILLCILHYNRGYSRSVLCWNYTSVSDNCHRDPCTLRKLISGRRQEIFFQDFFRDWRNTFLRCQESMCGLLAWWIKTIPRHLVTE